MTEAPRSRRVDVRGERKTKTISYECFDCRRTWEAKDRYQKWPIRFLWSNPLPGVKTHFFDWHAYQTGCYDLDARLFAQVFHVGRLRIILGRDNGRIRS